MPMMFVAAAMMLSQAPSTEPIIVDQKKKQVCEYVDATGSRMRVRVCHDPGAPAIAPNSTDAAPNAGMFHPPPPADPRPVFARPH